GTPSTSWHETLVAAAATAAVAAAATAAAITTTAAATAVAAAAAATTAATVLLGPGLVHRQVTAADLLTAHACDRRLRLGVAAHLDEAEPFGASGVAIHDDLRRLHGAERLEHLLQLAGVHVVAQVADVQLLAHLGLRDKGRAFREARAWIVQYERRVRKGV